MTEPEEDFTGPVWCKKTGELLSESSSVSDFETHPIGTAARIQSLEWNLDHASDEDRIRNDLLSYIERKCVDWRDPDSPVVPLSEIRRLFRSEI